MVVAVVEMELTDHAIEIGGQPGELLQSLDMPPGVGVSGLESDGGDQFFCGGGSSGKVRAVRRPKRD